MEQMIFRAKHYDINTMAKAAATCPVINADKQHIIFTDSEMDVASKPIFYHLEGKYYVISGHQKVRDGKINGYLLTKHALKKAEIQTEEEVQEIITHNKQLKQREYEDRVRRRESRSQSRYSEESHNWS